MQVRSLSPTEAKVVLSMEAEGLDEIALPELRRRARVSPGFAAKIASDLVRKGWLQRTGRGRYLLNPSRRGPEAIPDSDPLRLASRVVHPYYLGYSTAAELHGLLPQAGRVYYIVTPERRTPPTIASAELRMVRVLPTRFFGFRPLERRGERLSVSDVERTLLDCLARPELSGGIGGAVKVVHSAAPRLVWRRLGSHLDRLRIRSLELRLGFLLESFPDRIHPPADWLERYRARAADPFVPLGPPGEFGRRGPHDARWHLIRNVPEAQLRAEVDIR